jgi:tetratricopeptide (TPR) repeat protein
MKEPLFASMIARHLAERFGRRRGDLMTRAGDAVLLIAGAFSERNDSDRGTDLEKLYVESFPRHPRVAGFTYQLAQRRSAAGDPNGALAILEQLVNVHSNSPLVNAALSRMASIHKDLGAREKEIALLSQLSARLGAQPTPGALFISAKFREASAYRDLGGKHLPGAYNRYAEIVKLLKANAVPYARTDEERAVNEKILESSMVSRGLVLARLPPPEGKDPNSYRAAAVKLLEEFVTRFPKSDLAPTALVQIGTLQMMIGQTADSQKTFQRLQKEYPQSPAAKNSRFALAMALLANGQTEQAMTEFKRMFGEDAGSYTEAQILSAANQLRKARQYPIALQAYDRLLADSKDRAIREHALAGKGMALYENKQFAESAAPLEELLQTYTNTGYTVDACVALSEIYGTLGGREADEAKRDGLFGKAVEAMNKAKRHARQAGVESRAELIIGRIREQQARAAEQFGPPEKVRVFRGKAVAAYQILIGMRNPSDPAVRPHMEQAFAECIPLMLSMQRWQDALENCERYMQLFKDGRFAPEVRSWTNEARARLAIAAPATNAPAATEAPREGKNP